MKVLLLGATGNLGSRLLPALLAHNHQVTVYVRNEAKLKSLMPDEITSKIVIVAGNGTDSTAIQNALISNKCDALVNTAGMASTFSWQKPGLQDIEHAVIAAAVEASKELRWPIRAWFLGGITALDVPGMPGTRLSRYFPLYPEHALTHTHLSSQPSEHLKWSLLCPSYMKPTTTSPTLLSAPDGNAVKVSADVPPEFRKSIFHFVPFFGPFWSVLSNSMKYTITLKDAADFIAEDLTRTESEFVGHRVGIVEIDRKKAT